MTAQWGAANSAQDEAARAIAEAEEAAQEAERARLDAERQAAEFREYQAQLMSGRRTQPDSRPHMEAMFAASRPNPEAMYRPNPEAMYLPNPQAMFAPGVEEAKRKAEAEAAKKTAEEEAHRKAAAKESAAKSKADAEAKWAVAEAKWAAAERALMNTKTKAGQEAAARAVAEAEEAENDAKAAEDCAIRAKEREAACSNGQSTAAPSQAMPAAAAQPAAAYSAPASQTVLPAVTNAGYVGQSPVSNSGYGYSGQNVAVGVKAPYSTSYTLGPANPETSAAYSQPGSYGQKSKPEIGPSIRGGSRAREDSVTTAGVDERATTSAPSWGRGSNTCGSSDGTVTPNMRNVPGTPDCVSVAGDNLNRTTSFSTLDQLLDSDELLKLRAEREDDRMSERPVRYGARHLSIPIVIVSSEVNPWSKTGGLAMVAGSYGYEFAFRGHRTMVVAPRYANYPNCHKIGIASVWLNGQSHEVGYFHQRQDYGEGRACDFVFVDHDCYHRPQGLYGDPAKGGEYEDNCFRFSLLCLAAAEAPLVLDFGGSPYGQEVCFIANDWQTGMLPVYLQHKYKRNKTYSKARCMMVLHNMGYQGRYKKSKTPIDSFFGLPPEADADMQGDDMHWGQDTINLLSAGIKLADRVLTVSPNYAKEIQTPEGGQGLHDEIRDKWNEGRVAGILNGISDEWNPATDPHIAQRYDQHNHEEGKRRCKAAFQRELGLHEDPTLCLIGFCGRLCHQKGIHLITESIDWMMNNEGNGVNGHVQLVMMGKGETIYQTALTTAEANHRGRVCGYVGFDPAVEHRMMAACDILLMPSQYEPCGLPQMYAQQYGCLPVVHETGGLKDSVPGLWDENRDRHTAAGFLFCGFEVPKMKEKLWQAMHIFRKNKPLWRQLQLNAMRQNYYWPGAIDEYEKNIDRVMEDHGVFRED